MTQMRGEEREKRRSAGQGSSPVSPRTVHGTTSGSPLRKSKSTIKITVSPTRASVASSHSHARTLSMVSTDDSVFHSARHSPVSQVTDRAQSAACSPTSFVTADELHDRDSPFSLSETDELQKPAECMVSSLPHVKASVASNEAVTTRPAAPKLSLRIPRTSSPSTDRKYPSKLGSASSSGSQASPSRTSRIPRAAPVESTVKAASIQRTQARSSAMSKNTTQHDTAQHLQTLNSTGTTPIVFRETYEKSSNPSKDAIVNAYLESVEPNFQPDGIPSSRAMSVSTVKAVLSVDPVLQDAAVVSFRKKPDAAGMTPNLYD
jgi:hypothetical protein